MRRNDYGFVDKLGFIRDAPADSGIALDVRNRSIRGEWYSYKKDELLSFFFRQVRDSRVSAPFLPSRVIRYCPTNLVDEPTATKELTSSTISAKVGALARGSS